MTHSLKTRIILIIFLTVTVSVSAFLVFETSINARIYGKQIENEIRAIVKLNVGEVDHYTSMMEQKASDIARSGEVLYRLRKNISDKAFDAEVEKYLVDNFTTFDKAIGGGIWYEPNKIHPDKKYYGPYAFWDKGHVVFTWDLNTPKYDYFNQSWYTLALPPTFDRSTKPEHEYYWTAPYYDEAGTFQLMITVDAFIHDDEGTIIGISTADWSIERMLTFLRNSRITEDSQIFLVDATSNTIMANTLNPESVMKNLTSVPWMLALKDPQKNVVKETEIELHGITYRAYYTRTEAGMFYGTLVPTTVLSVAVNKLNGINIILFTVFDLILVLVLYFVLSRVTNPIIELTGAVSRIANGDLSARMKISTKDEIGELASGFNKMVAKISEQKKQLEERTVSLEDQVKERTAKIEQQNKELTALKNNLETDLQKKYAELVSLKNSLESMVEERTRDLDNKVNELERLNKFMVDRELAMMTLKNQITALEKEVDELKRKN